LPVPTYRKTSLATNAEAEKSALQRLKTVDTSMGHVTSLTDDPESDFCLSLLFREKVAKAGQGRKITWNSASLSARYWVGAQGTCFKIGDHEGSYRGGESNLYPSALFIREMQFT